MEGFYGEKSGTYEYAQFVIPASQSNWNVSQNVSNLLKNGPYGYCKITTNQAIGVHFNNIAADAIQYTSSESPITVNVLSISNIFIDTGASGATVGILLVKI